MSTFSSNWLAAPAGSAQEYVLANAGCCGIVELQ
jgi:hypothetical protein